jgi:hypothetical protein
LVAIDQQLLGCTKNLGSCAMRLPNRLDGTPVDLRIFFTFAHSYITKKIGYITKKIGALSLALAEDHSPLDGGDRMTRVTLGKSRMQKAARPDLVQRG